MKTNFFHQLTALLAVSVCTIPALHAQNETGTTRPASREGDIPTHEIIAHGTITSRTPDALVMTGDNDADRSEVQIYRVDVAESRAQGGTGLGLALVKHILNRHGGRLVIDSSLGTGATFTVRLPMLPDQATSPEITQVGSVV